MNHLNIPCGIWVLRIQTVFCFAVPARQRARDFSAVNAPFKASRTLGAF